MTTFKIVIAASFVAAPAVFAAEPAPACSPQYVSTHTDFPAAARALRAHGVVYVDIKLNGDGRAAEAIVKQSSGHVLLDQAAVDSVRKHWRFDVTNCTAADLTTQHTVEVQFRRPAGNTLSGTVNRKAPVEARDLLARNRCDVVRDAPDTTIYSCVKNSSAALVNTSARATAEAKQP